MVWWTFPTQVWHIMRPDGITCKMEWYTLDIAELSKMSLESGTWKTGMSIWRMMEGLMDTIFQVEKRNKERKI